MDIVIVSVVAAVLFAIVVWLVFREQGRLRADLKSDLEQTAKSIEQRQAEVLRNLDQATMLLGSMKEGFGSVQEIGRQIGSLQDFLRSPKMRGNIGEEILKELLENHLPKGSFVIQHSFKDGNTVDAIIRVGKRILPIDAKFPMENAQRVLSAKTEPDYEESYKLFKRDVKRHIDAISTKYISPSEFTTDFAFMYVPSETIWYQTVKDDDELSMYARRKNVYLVSPNSFYYALQIVLRVMESERMQEKVLDVLSGLKTIRHTARIFFDQMMVLGKHITNAKKTMDSTMLSFEKLNDQIDSVSTLKLDNPAAKEEDEQESAIF